MTITDIENMTAAELKAARTEAAEAVKTSPDLAARYVQARLDAKMRDEKLAEQGKTITLLQAALEKSAAENAGLAAALADAKRVTAHEQAERGRAEAKVNDLTAKLQSETDRAERLKAQATRHAQALHAAEMTIKNASALTEIETADKGE